MAQFDLRRCDFSKCKGECLTECLFVDYDEKQAKSDIAKLIAGEGADILRDCVTCYACNEFCPTGANPWELINFMQQKTGMYIYPPEAKKTAKGWTTKPDEVIKGDGTRPAISLCGFQDVLPWKGVFKGAIFEGMTIIKGGSYCCRMGATHMGVRDAPFDYLPTLVKNLAATGEKEIVFYHDACYGLVTAEARAQNIEVPFKPIHLAQFLRDWLRDNKDKITPLNKKFAYQRPCTSRYNPHGDLDENLFDWIEEIAELIGLEVVHRKYEYENSMCCGSGIFPTQHDRAMGYVKKNLQDAKDAGAEVFAYFCPVCTAVMRASTRDAGFDPYHIIMLAQKALGEELPYGGAAIGQPVH